MELKPGSRIGPYEIVSRIGAGGMGEVFRARDTRLERTVAIKVMPSELASNAALKLRFEQEARAISRLNHPHICTLHDVGSENGTDYLVMELMEGETLADRIARGPLPLADVLKIGAQIAHGLDAAHRAGVVHRDLKPGNIMLTKSGAKLLDFGLAKSAVAAPGLDGATIQKGLTQEGTILGTFQYMAPEQLEGEPADARTDIFALGCVLYEMITGRRAFEGKTRTSLIAAIVSSEPAPVSAVAPLTPPALEHVVRRCLAKEPDDRWQSAHDVAAELEWIADPASQPAATRIAARPRRERLLWLGALLLAIAATAAVATRWRRDETTPVSYHFLIPTREADYRNSSLPLLSPDGTMAVISARRSNGETWLFVRRLDRFAVTPLVAVQGIGGSRAFWSPDSRQLAYRAGDKLFRIDIEDAQPQFIADAPMRNGAWAPDGTILLGQLEGPLLQLSSRGGVPTPITKPDAAKFERGHHEPVFLPNGKDFLFITYTRNPGRVDAPHTLYAGRLGSREIKRIGEVTSAVRYAAGHLFYVRGGALTAVPFDPDKLVFTGEPVVIAEDVQFHFSTGQVSFSVARDGTVSWLPRPHADNLIIADRSGKLLREIATNDDFVYAPSVSGDGTRMVIARRDPAFGSFDIWMYGLDRPAATRLTFDSADDGFPVLSKDGTQLYYGSDRQGIPDLYVKQVHDAQADRLLLQRDRDQRANDVSRDGRYLIYSSTERGNADLFAWSLRDSKSVAVVQTPAHEELARLSPDASLIAYQSDASGRTEIVVRPFLRPGIPRQVSTNGGRVPKWSADGRTLFFLSAERSIMQATVNGDAIGDPQLVFPSQREIGTYEPLPDGRFLLLVVDEEARARPARVIARWTSRSRS